MPVLIRIPKHSPLVNQILVIGALLQREITSRFGKYKLGFFWMLLEPLVSVIFLGLILGSIMERTVPQIPYSFFLLNGFMFLKLFTGPMTSSMGAASSNQGLLVYASVRPLDLFLARFVFELATSLFSYVVFCIAGLWLGVDISLAHLHVLFACFILTWIAGCGLGLIFGVAGAYFKELEKIVPLLQRPLLFTSAILAPLTAVPINIQPWFLYNPIVHTVELSRQALFPRYFVDGPNLLYPTTFAIVVCAIGLTLFRNNRHYLSQR